MASVVLNTKHPIVCGAEACGYAKVTKDDETGITFGEVKQFARMRKVSIEPVIAGDDINSNDAVEVSGGEVVGYKIGIDITGMPPEEEATIYGNEVDSKGGIVEKDGDHAEPIAILLKLKMSGGHHKYTVLYNCVAQKHTEEAETQTSSGKTYSMPTINLNASKTAKGLLRYTLRSDAENFDKELADAWFDEVHLPAEASA